MFIDIYCDGASRGNPGHSAIGVIVHTDNSVHAISYYYGIHTNNEAEYEAIRYALYFVPEVLNYKGTSLKIYTDSQLCVNQLNDKWKVNDLKMERCYYTIKNMIQYGSLNVTFTWLPRELNKFADRTANLALDAYLASFKEGDSHDR